MTNSRLFAMLLLFAAPASVGIVRAEEPAGEDRGNLTVVEPSYRSWDIEDDNGGKVTIRQFYVPFSESVRLGDRADLIAFGAFAPGDMPGSNGDRSSPAA